MKKIALFLSVMLVLTLSLAACAQTPAAPADPTAAPVEATETPAETGLPAEETVVIGGTVLEITEEGYLIYNETNGEVLVLVGEATVIEKAEDSEIAVNDYIYVDHNGAMTMSIPAQVNAQVVRMHKLEGDVTEVYAEENAVLLNTLTHGEVRVTLPEVWKDTAFDAAYLTVYFNGAMTMSIPAQVNAGHAVPGYFAQGEVTEIAEEYIMLTTEEGEMQVNFAAGTLPETVQTDAIVRVRHNGQMTRSIPAQVFAAEIMQVSR